VGHPDPTGKGNPEAGAEGHENKEIADHLCISLKTVEKHRANLMEKLGLHNVASLTALAAEKGLINE